MKKLFLKKLFFFVGVLLGYLPMQGAAMMAVVDSSRKQKEEHPHLRLTQNAMALAVPEGSQKQQSKQEPSRLQLMQSAIVLALQENNMSAFRLALKRMPESSINARCFGCGTLLMNAVMQGNESAVKALLAKGANPDLFDSKGDSAFTYLFYSANAHEFSKEVKRNIFGLLIQKNGPSNERQAVRNFMLQVCKKGDIECLGLLLESKISFDLKNTHGLSIFVDIAIATGALETLCFFAENGIDHQGPDEGMTYLSMALFMVDNIDNEQVESQELKELLERKCLNKREAYLSIVNFFCNRGVRIEDEMISERRCEDVKLILTRCKAKREKNSKKKKKKKLAKVLSKQEQEQEEKEVAQVAEDKEVAQVGDEKEEAEQLAELLAASLEQEPAQARELVEDRVGEMGGAHAGAGNDFVCLNGSVREQESNARKVDQKKRAKKEAKRVRLLLNADYVFEEMRIKKEIEQKAARDKADKAALKRERRMHRKQELGLVQEVMHNQQAAVTVCDYLEADSYAESQVLALGNHDTQEDEKIDGQLETCVYDIKRCGHNGTLFTPFASLSKAGSMQEKAQRFSGKEQFNLDDRLKEEILQGRYHKVMRLVKQGANPYTGNPSAAEMLQQQDRLDILTSVEAIFKEPDMGKREHDRMGEVLLQAESLLGQAVRNGDVSCVKAAFALCGKAAAVNRVTFVMPSLERGVGMLDNDGVIVDSCFNIINRLNDRGETPLFTAIRHGHFDVATELLKTFPIATAGLYIKNKSQQTLFDFLFDFGKAEVIERDRWYSSDMLMPFLKQGWHRGRFATYAFIEHLFPVNPGVCIYIPEGIYTGHQLLSMYRTECSLQL